MLPVVPAMETVSEGVSEVLVRVRLMTNILESIISFGEGGGQWKLTFEIGLVLASVSMFLGHGFESGEVVSPRQFFSEKLSSASLE